MKKILLRVGRILLMIVIFIIVLVLSINLPIATFHHQTSSNSYEDWMTNTLSEDQRIIDVAMLGAHDAFTSDMNGFSAVDKESAESIQTGITGFLIKGFSFRQSKTQVSDTLTLLESGVRYFDMRLTYNENKQMWMTSHTYFSTPLEEVLADLSSFLEDHPGEFVIIDIQHVNGVDYSDLSSFQEIRELFVEASLLDYMYQDNIKPLDEITYGDVTNNQTQAGLVVLTKYEEEDSSFFSYQTSIRSAWANTDSEDALFTFLDDETSLIESGNAMTGNQVSNNEDAIDSLEGFRVMQGVLTMQMSGDGIVNALMDWSLLERAIRVNNSLIKNDHFDTWLESMPIVMVDYANTNNSSFLDEIMQKIIDFNEN